MASIPRVDVAGVICHAYNRASSGKVLFVTPQDYKAFENLMQEAGKLVDMRILAYCLMPNHWHFVLQPKEDGDIAKFFHWFSATHAKRRRAFLETTGEGHIYQDRYKSNICQEDGHFLRLVRYVERNALRANLVARAEDWRWSSLYKRLHGSYKEKSILAEWPVPEPRDYLEFINTPQNTEELEAIRHALRRGSPYGAGMWHDEAVRIHRLESTIRLRGRQPRS